MIQRALVSLAIAFLLMAHPCLDLVEAHSMIRYHSTIALAPLVVALLLDLFILASLFFLGMFAARRLRIWPWVSLLLAAWLPLLLLRRVGLLLGHTISSRAVQGLFVAIFLVFLYLSRKHRPAFAALMQTGSAILAFLGFSSFLVAAAMVPIAFRKPAQPIAIHTAMLPVHAGPHSRIVWIVFDELSYDQTFGHRLTGLQLPAFDALSRESITYTMTQPVGDKTEMVLPSLILGKVITDLDYTGSDHLVFQQPESTQWTRFEAADTPFAMAKQRGWNTGVVGWYNPYCSLLQPYVDDCYWANEDMGKAAWTLPDGKSGFSGAMTGLGAVFGSHKSKVAIDTEAGRSRLHLLSQQQIIAHALTLAANDRVDLMFLHLPVPHFPNDYDRHTAEFTLHGNSYADNLVFADHVLSSLMAVLQKSPRWPDTMLILCGDHSWRTTWWRGTPYWTAEDERISHGGQFDPRPALMVHFPGETAAFVNPEAISLLEVHRILVDMISSGHVQINIPGFPQAQPSKSK